MTQDESYKPSAQRMPQGKIHLDAIPYEENATPLLKSQAIDEQTFIPEQTYESRATSLQAEVLGSSSHRLLTLGVLAVAVLALAQLALFIYQKWLASPIWGGMWLFAVVLILIGMGKGVIRELLRLKQLAWRQDARSQADDLLKHQGVGQAQRFCQQLAQKTDMLGSESYQYFLAQLGDSHNDKEVLVLYSGQVLASQDRLAQQRIAKWAGEAAALVALSPLAVVDMVLILWRNMKMIEDIAVVYGIELGYWSRVSLIRNVLRNVIYTGVSELISEVGMDLLGADLAAKLSVRGAQGVGAGLLTARLGLRCMEVCRPLPWCGDEKPTLKDLRKRLLEQLASLFKSKEA